MHRFLAAGIWLVLTITATVIVWAAVSVVAADVTDRPAPVVAQHAVAAALKDGSSTTTTVATTTTQGTRPPNQPPGTSRSATPTTAAGRTSSTTASPAPVITVVPVAPPTTAPAGHPAPTTSTTAAPAGATYSTAGGVVTVACTSVSSIELVAALPFDGFQAVVVSGGPHFVALGFVGQGQTYSVGASCAFGQPFPFTSRYPGP